MEYLAIQTYDAYAHGGDSVIVEMPEGMNEDQTYCEWMRQARNTPCDKTDEKILKDSHDHWEKIKIVKLKGHKQPDKYSIFAAWFLWIITFAWVAFILLTEFDFIKFW